MSLFRNVFWLGVLALGLAVAPDFGVLGPAANEDRERAGFQDLFYVISATVTDLGEICDRRPDVCERMDRIGEQFRNRAVRITGAAHDWLIGSNDSDAVPARAEAPPAHEPEAPPERSGDRAYHVAKTQRNSGE